MKKILLIFGTRPEAIKMAPLVNHLKKYPNDFKTTVCVTGQHRQMLDQVLDLFDITPEYDLNIMNPKQDLYDITSNVLLGVRDVLKTEKPDIVFVHGDTTTSTTSALAAFYQQIPVAHVEAGLRTYNIYSPWPEEINRQITGRISTYHFAPTQNAKTNLTRENISPDNIYVTGNTVIDALHIVVDKLNNDSTVADKTKLKLHESGYDIESSINTNKKIVLITGHRRENFGEGFLNICNAIRNLANSHKDVDFIYPMHLNPNVREPVLDILGKDNLIYKNVYLIEPLEYLPFVFLMSKSYIILTDSGGIQEEAPGLGKPVLVMRDTTERPEAIAAGTVKLVGTNKKTIEDNVSKLLIDNNFYLSMSKSQNPYGDGKASERIVEFLKHELVKLSN